MPYENAFRHQTYHDRHPTAPYHVLIPAAPSEPGSDAFVAEMADLGRRLRVCGVNAILLVHGTFTGTDLTGWISQIERVAPGIADRLRAQEKWIVDSLAGEIANYSPSYAQALEQGINASGDEPITVRRFQWSSQNHHLGRADGAVRLFAELLAMPSTPSRRTLLWGHSHAGNLFALLTHMIGATSDVCQRLVRAMAGFYQNSRGVVIDPIWNEVSAAMARRPPRLELPDIVTFGTPIRYGWETHGYRTLTHFVHHRPDPYLPPYRVPFPPTWDQVTTAARGDFLQQFAIAGTNFPVNLFSWRDWRVEGKLKRLLQPKLSRRHAWSHWRCGLRVPQEGKTLLVDYHEADPSHATVLVGHGIYTFTSWLPFHLDQLLRHTLEPHCHG